MILLDKSRGSVELLHYFKPFGISVELSNLVPYGGDAWFMGKGSEGDITVAIERKRITDLIDSMRTKRLKGYHMPLMADNYDLVYIIVEGMWRPGDDGACEEWRRVHGTWQWVPLGVQYRAVDNFMTSIGHHCNGVKRSSTPQETVHQIVDLYRMYEEAPTLRSNIYLPEPTGRPGTKVRTLSKPRWVEKFCYLLPGLDAKLYTAADHFKTIRRAVNAPTKDWILPGIGKITAERIQRALDSEGAE